MEIGKINFFRAANSSTNSTASTENGHHYICGYNTATYLIIIIIFSGKQSLTQIKNMYLHTNLNGKLNCVKLISAIRNICNE